MSLLVLGSVTTVSSYPRPSGRHLGKLVTLAKFAESNQDIDADDLKVLLSSQMSTYTPIWMLMLGLVLGGLLERALNVVIFDPSGLSPTGLLIQSIFAIFMGGLIVGLLYSLLRRGNPFRIQEKLFEDYLKARRIVQARKTPKSVSDV